MKAIHFPGAAAISTLTKVGTLALVFALVLPSASALADERRDFDDRRSFDRSWNSDRRHFNNGWRREGGNQWDTRRKNWRNDRDERKRRHRDDNTSISVNLSFGHVTGSNWRPYYREYEPRRHSAFGFGSQIFPGLFGHHDDHRPVIVYQNNYIEETRPVVRSKTYTSTRTGTSLLREVSGRCFERTVDKRGIERRTEVPASVCNF